MSEETEKIVPPQHEGGEKNIEEKVKTVDDNDARKLFFIARNRLLDVNRWQEVAGPATASFTLIGSDGQPVNRTAEKGDYFKIDIPGPGSNEGHGADWVQVEAIEDKSDPNGPYECIALRVRPTPNPQDKTENVAHFFNDHATSSFVVERHGAQVTAAVYGRNEVANTESHNLLDKVRNAVVGTTAKAGASDIQWKALVKGLVETKE